LRIHHRACARQCGGLTRLIGRLLRLVRRRLRLPGGGYALVCGGLSLRRRSLVGLNLLLLGYLDGKGVRIEGDLRGIKLPFGIANAPPRRSSGRAPSP